MKTTACGAAAMGVSIIILAALNVNLTQALLVVVLISATLFLGGRIPFMLEVAKGNRLAAMRTRRSWFYASSGALSVLLTFVWIVPDSSAVNFTAGSIVFLVFYIGAKMSCLLHGCCNWRRLPFPKCPRLQLVEALLVALLLFTWFILVGGSSFRHIWIVFGAYVIARTYSSIHRTTSLSLRAAVETCAGIFWVVYLAWLT